MHHAAQEHAVEAGIRKRQLLDIAFEEFDIGCLRRPTAINLALMSRPTQS